MDTDISFVDEHDTVIGSGPKKEAWEKGIRHRLVRVYLKNSNGDILVAKRAAHLRLYPGK